MFSTPATLDRRTGRFGVNRYNYLKQLVDEYEKTTTNNDHKEQIIANLANFSYDPINYEYIRRLNIIDIFLNLIKTPTNNVNLLNFSIAGVCNLCLDEKNKAYLIDNSIVDSLKSLMLSNNYFNNDTILTNILTTLTFLNNEQIKTNHITNDNLFVNKILAIYNSSKNKILTNIIQVFLEEFSISVNK